MNEPDDVRGSHAQRTTGPTRRDIAIVIVGFVLSFGANVALDPFGWLVRFDTAHPSVRLDDLALAVMWACLFLVWFAWRRWREQVRAHRAVLEQQRALESAAVDLVAARDAALAASNVKSAFLRTMSHELRTPLNAIIGFSELLADSLPRQQEREITYATHILASGRDLLRMIDDILDGSKMDADILVPNYEEFDIIDLIDGCLRVVRPLAASAGVALSVATSETLPIMADEKMLTRLLFNLVTNAIRFTDAGGTAEIRAKAGVDARGNARIELVIADTGIGMTDDEIEIALQPFRQVDGSLSRRHDGVGLGLPLARRIAECHGGSLSVTSAPRRGTTVRVFLPLGGMPSAQTLATEAYA